MFPSRSLQVFGIKQNRHGAIIEEFDLHMFSEPTRRNRQSAVTNQANEVLAEPIRAIWWSGRSEAGTPSSATISEQGELAYHKD